MEAELLGQYFAIHYSIDPTDYNPNAHWGDICLGHANAIPHPEDRTNEESFLYSFFLDISIAIQKSNLEVLVDLKMAEEF